MHQQLWGYKVEEKLDVGVREQKTLNTAGLVCIPKGKGKQGDLSGTYINRTIHTTAASTNYYCLL
jgi:hypothetical protein